MRRRMAVALLLALAMDMAGSAAARADDGTLLVKIREAVAYKKGNDDTFGPQQDFYAINSIDGMAPLFTPEVGNHDDASWSPPQTNVKIVPGKNQRYFDLYFELWDKDTCCFGNVDDGFDISPQNGPPGPLAPGGVYVPGIPTGSNPHVQYDVCTGEMVVVGVNGSPWLPIGSNSVELNGYGTTPGVADNWGALRFDVERQPSNWLPDDVAVDSAEIVQAVYHASRAVADKSTALVVRISSTYPADISAPIEGHLTDGITTVNDSRLIVIKGGSPSQPGHTLVALFDGSTAPPFKPQKSFLAGTGKVSGWARVNYQEVISPNAPPDLIDCANLNNTGNATDLPLMHTQDLVTQYERFDYQEDDNLMTPAQLQAMFNREETFRLASWPLASLDSKPTWFGYIRDHGSNLWCPFEPVCTLLYYNGIAAAGNVDRLVLGVRKGWFSDNAFRHQFVPLGLIGLSLGTHAPRAVLAEDGYYCDAVHELGHTNGLSQHPCSNGSPPFGPGCLDEYLHPASDGAPYEAEGYDVTGTIYPGGMHVPPSAWPNLACPATVPDGRDICAPNLMDANSGSGYRNWLDAFTFQYLMENPLPHSDPPVLNVTGYIRFPNGQGDGTVPPAVEGSLAFFNYQFMGIQDLPDAPLSPVGEAFSGLGPFRIRLATPAGVHDYRFNPRFFDDPALPDLVGGFSINVPWDPATTSIQLIGPSDPWNVPCWNSFCSGDGVLLDQRLVTAFPPSPNGLRAGRDVEAPPPPAGGVTPTPTIGPGHDAVISWDASDPDSTELRAALILVKQDAAGGTTGGATVPLAIDIAGNTFRIPHSLMADDPGLYAGRLLVSDGANTTEIWNGALFNACNLSNGGVEVCNGLDDDCDGLVDNALPPGPISVMLNPQPQPPGGGDVIAWTADASSQSYDVVYGDLGALRDSGGSFAIATQGCLADDTTATTAPLAPVPAVGQGFFFLMRGNNCTGPGTYDSGGTRQAAPRDAGINSSALSCHP